jgi:hypothetical protein
VVVLAWTESRKQPKNLFHDMVMASIMKRVDSGFWVYSRAAPDHRRLSSYALVLEGCMALKRNLTRWM